MPKISVIVPVYNSAYLGELFESIFVQSMSDWEMICVNDGAPDNSLEVLQSYAAKEPRIRVVDQANGGCSAAINKGMQYVSGDYVFLIGHDDTISPDLFENVCKRASQTQADCIVPDVMMGFNTDKPWLWNQDKKTDLNQILTGRQACAMTVPWNLHCWAFWKRDIYINTPYATFNSFNPDEYTGRELLLKCEKVAFCKGVYNYRFVDGGTSRKFSLRQYDVFSTDIAVIELLIKNKMDNTTIGRARKILLDNIIVRINSVKELPKEQQKIANDKLIEAFMYFKKCKYKMSGSQTLKSVALMIIPHLGYRILKIAVQIKQL